VRVIGPQCGAKVEGGDLFVKELKAFERRQRQERVEAKLEWLLPLMPKLIGALEELRPALTEANRLYRKLRGDNSDITRHFRQLKRQHGGQLTVDVVIEKPREERKPQQKDDEDDGRPERIGPRGFGREGGVDTYSQSFGVLAGEVMFSSEFKPLDKLDELLAGAREVPTVKDGDAAYLWLCENESLELFEHFVDRLNELEAGYLKLVEQVASVRSFFDREFFARLDQYGRHRDTRFKLEASVEEREGVYMLSHGGRRAKLRPDLAALAVKSAWP